MTIAEAISKVDLLKPNQYPTEEKIKWIMQLEGQIYTEIVATHHSPPCIRPPIDREDVDTDMELIAQYPYDELYIYYLYSKIDLNNMETVKYNNDSTLFNNAMLTFRDYWNRNYMPREKVHTFKMDERRRHHVDNGRYGMPRGHVPETVGCPPRRKHCHE